MSESSDQNTHAKKRKWPRRLLITFATLLILGFLLNGPVARWGVAFGLNKALEGQGMTGSVGDVSGSLASGFEINDIDYSGTEGIQQIKIDQAAVDYSISDLFDKKIEAIHLSQGDVVIDTAKFKSSQEPDKPKTDFRDTIANIHPWVSQANINVRDLNVDVLTDDERQAKFDIGELSHQSGSDDFSITNFTAEDQAGRVTPSQDVNIEWTPEGASIDNFEVLPDVALKNVNLDWSGDITGLADLEFLGSNLDVNIDETITAKLQSGTITARELNERFKLDLPIDFTLNTLDAKIEDWQKQPIPSWTVQGTIGTEKFSYGQYKLTNATIDLSQKDEQFNLTLDTSLNGTPLTLKLDGKWERPDSERWFSSFTTNYELKTNQLGTLVNLWYQPPAGLNLTPTTITATGEFAMLQNEITTATLEGEIANIKANQTTLPPLAIEADYLPGTPINASVKSGDRLRVAGSYELSTKAYQGNVAIAETDPAWMNALANIFGQDLTLAAPVALAWNGKGTADPTMDQSGSIVVEELHLKHPDQPQFSLTTKTSYDWPKGIQVNSLAVREDQWLATTNLSWDGNTIRLPDFSLKNGETEIASASGIIPFTAQIDSLEKFLAQKNDFNLVLKTKPLALQQIDEWLEMDIVKNVTGTTELDLEISGTPAKPNLQGKFEALSIRGLDDSSLKPLDLRLNFLTENKRLNLTASLFEADVDRLSLAASLPYTPDTWLNDPDFSKNILDTGPISADLKINTLPIQRFKKFFPENLKSLSGQLDANLSVKGTPNDNAIDGALRASNIQGIADDELAPLNFAVDLNTENEKLNVNATLSENNENRLTLESTIPYNPAKWVSDPDFFDEFIATAPLRADLDIKTLPLNRLKPFVPKLEKIDGSLSGTGTLSGTLEDPKYQVNMEANIPLIKLDINEIDKITDTKLKVRFKEDRLVVSNLSANVNGGQFQADGTINLEDFSNPLLDMTLQTKYALVHRDDLMSIRANTSLRVQGIIEQATISGTIGIAESLFYKDIELIPVGVPSSAAAKVNLPSADTAQVDSLPIPEPFGNWKLDLTIRTDDPVLIRGNIAKGSLGGSISVGGTLAEPAPEGTLYLNDVRAKLPFSILEIPRGEVRFNPRDALNPTLEIRGKSTVGSYDVSVFVYGPATNPKTAFTSYPPLPESEVMTLLATGTTTSGLEDQDVATFKAFQIFLLELKQRAEKPGGNKLFAKLLDGVDDLNLRVGEKDQFTGQKYSSATIDLSERWHFTAQFGAEQNTRGLMVYVIRFR